MDQGVDHARPARQRGCQNLVVDGSDGDAQEIIVAGGRIDLASEFSRNGRMPLRMVAPEPEGEQRFDGHISPGQGGRYGIARDADDRDLSSPSSRSTIPRITG